MKSWFGKKKGMTINGINCDRFSAVLQDIIMTGLIFQIDEITGSTVRVPIDFPSWEPGRKYAYYSRVPHNGSTWLCVNDKALLPSHPKTIRTGLYQPPKVTRVIRACLWSVAVIGNPPRPRTRPIPWSLWRVVFLSPKSRPPILPSRSQGSGTAIIERKRTAVISLPGSQPTGPCMRTGRCCWTGVS